MIWNDRIRQLRELNKMTLKEVSNKLGVTEATAQRYEAKNGIKNIPYDIIEKYARMFDVSPAYIMGWDSPDLLVTEKDSSLKLLIEFARTLPANKIKQMYELYKYLYEQEQKEKLRTKFESRMFEPYSDETNYEKSTD